MSTSSMYSRFPEPSMGRSDSTATVPATVPARFGGKYFQGQCNVNDCIPFWIFAAMVCIQIVSIFVFAKTIDKDTGMVRSSSLMEKIKSAFKTLLIDLILGAAIFYFCRNCSTDWAWFILFLPLILMGLLFFVFVGSISMLGNSDKSRVVVVEPSAPPK